MSEEYGVVLFHTTSAVLRAEKLLKGAGIPCKLIPVPRQLSSNCGISLRFAWPQAEEIRDILENARVDTAGIHRLE
ncbi:MAG: DUF3343 domain-containing protein [Anaerolineae bacterium]|nr:DUF3343 domain-containing protein [Anaerolineae bacterium]